MSFQILIDEPLPTYTEAMLVDECQLYLWPEVADQPKILAQIEGFYVYGHLNVDGPFMDKLPKLRVISNNGVGVDHVDLAAAQARGIPVGNTPHILDGATADMTFALLLAAARNVVIGDRYARSPEFTVFDPRILHGYEVHGTTLGIIGMGNIGRQVAKRARGFDMRVLYHNRRRNPEAEAELGAEYLALDDLLAQADFVSLNLPLTPETHHLIGRRELGLMKSTAFIINLARGGVIDHDALVDALNTGQIAGAALDVTEPEPLPRDHPLLSMDKIVIAPHLGSATHQTRYGMARLSADNLLAGLKGEALPSPLV